MCLTFVNVENIDLAYEMILNNKPGRHSAINKFITYFEQTWFGEHARFKKSTWNHSNTIGPRTNNHIEGFHSALNRSIGFSKPSFFKLIEKFRELEALSSINYERAAMELDVPKRRKQDIENDEKLHNLISDMNNQKIDIEKFLNQAIIYIATRKK